MHLQRYAFICRTLSQPQVETPSSLDVNSHHPLSSHPPGTCLNRHYGFWLHELTTVGPIDERTQRSVPVTASLHQPKWPHLCGHLFVTHLQGPLLLLSLKTQNALCLLASEKWLVVELDCSPLSWAGFKQHLQGY